MQAQIKSFFVVVALIAMVILTGCTEEILDVIGTATPSMTNENTTITDNVTTPEVIIQAELPAWHYLPLVDARTGETFTFADFAGKTIFVEPMATWCSNCRTQLRTVSSIRDQFDSEQVVFIALSVEVGLGNDTLAQYTRNNGFDWTFAVITTDLLAELVNVFGRTVTNPPSTPHFIIRPDGTTSALATGFKSADALIAEIRAESGL